MNNLRRGMGSRKLQKRSSFENYEESERERERELYINGRCNKKGRRAGDRLPD